jgi:hypothetical protein
VEWLFSGIFTVLKAIVFFIFDFVLSLILALVYAICLFLPTWTLPDFTTDSSFLYYARFVAYYIPFDYALLLYTSYLTLLVLVKAVRGVMSIIQVDI